MMHDAVHNGGPLAGPFPFKRLSLVMEAAFVARFYGIMQSGFFVEARMGDSVRDLLCGQLGIPAEYVAERISTLFLDGKPVDDIDSATIKEGSTLALSSAMPGLVGATMRRRGVYSVLRDSITYREKDAPPERKEGIFRIKLFNLLTEELGPYFLGRGIFVQSAELAGFLAEQPDDFWDGCREITLDDEHTDPSLFGNRGWPAGYEWVYLVVTT